MIGNIVVALFTVLCLLSVPSFAASFKTLWGEVSDLSEVTSKKSPQRFGNIANQHDGADLRLVSSFRDQSNIVHNRYDQYFKGLPVFGQQIITHESKHKSDTKFLVTGRLVKNLAQEISSVIPKITEDMALRIALKSFAETNKVKNVGHSLPLTSLIVYLEKNGAAAKLAYRVSFFVSALDANNKKVFQNPVYIIDAINGAVIRNWNDLRYSGTIQNIGTGPGGFDVADDSLSALPRKYYFGSTADSAESNRFDAMRITVDGTNCAMSNEYFTLNDQFTQYLDEVHKDIESAIPVSVATQNSYPSLAAPVQYTCSMNSEYKYDGGDTAVNARSPNDNVFYFSNEVVSLYKEKYGIPDPFAHKTHGPVFLYTHLNAYDNAFAIGEQKDDDGSIYSKQQAFFGNGDSELWPLIDPDIVAHELGHLFTRLHSDLIYADQSGGINESFSDVIGMSFKLYLNQNFSWYNWREHVSSRWVIGDDIYQQVGPMRYLDNPTLDGSSIAFAKDYTQGMDTHYSSGVYNRAYYLMSTQYSADGLEPFGVAKLFVDANVKYWVPSSTFDYAACGVEQAAVDAGYTKKQLQGIANAFLEVGVQCRIG